MKKKRSFRKNVLMVMLGGLLAFSCIATLPDAPPKSEAELAAQAAADRFRRAQIRCENELESRMADPDGFRVADYALWERRPESTVDRIVFAFEAVGKNAFGALVPAQAACTVEWQGDRWKVTDLILE